MEVSIKSSWLHSILLKMPLLSIINEIYFPGTQKQPERVQGRHPLKTKIAQLQAPGLQALKIADCNSRQRFGKA